MNFRFREWGSVDWTYITLLGDLDHIAVSILGAGLWQRFHCQTKVDGKWENL